MFSWSIFDSEPKVAGQRSPEELVTNTLMLELRSLTKRAERPQQVRGVEGQRRRSSVDYSWLATAQQRPPYEPSPGELLELRDLCCKIRPAQCGPVILRLRKLVTEFEPDAHEVPRLLRTVLLDTLDDDEQSKDFEDKRDRSAGRWDKQRSKSLSFITFRSRFFANALRGSPVCDSPTEDPWPGEDEDEDDTLTIAMARRSRRVKSMPEINPMEEVA